MDVKFTHLHVFAVNPDGQAQQGAIFQILDFAKPTAAMIIAKALFTDVSADFGVLTGVGFFERFQVNGTLLEDGSWLGVPEITGYNVYLATGAAVSALSPLPVFTQIIVPNSVNCSHCFENVIQFDLPPTNI